MPAFPYRRGRGVPTTPLEHWEPPARPGLDDARAVIRGAAIGLAAGTAMWAAAILVSTIAYRWVAG